MPPMCVVTADSGSRAKRRDADGQAITAMRKLTTSATRTSEARKEHMKRLLNKLSLMKRLIPIVTFFATLSLATGVAAASSQYLLRQPAREHCRRNYVRDTKTVRIKGRRVRQV